MTALEIVKRYLREHGCDGLVRDSGECGCTIDDLAPCCQSFVECEAAKNDPEKAKDQGCDFWMMPVEGKGA
jgi:hypothetical protein